jgi:phenylpyruvate tautomerase PptA (4-oxalocrotonate tautomerase family)
MYVLRNVAIIVQVNEIVTDHWIVESQRQQHQHKAKDGGSILSRKEQ